jgi:Arc/MetJ-type ribon-helix-helix transcriptional regulator
MQLGLSVIKMDMPRITIQISFEEYEKIEQRIKREYPRLKTLSELVREALTQYLEKMPGEAT